MRIEILWLAGWGYARPKIVPCQDSLLESFSAKTVRPGMARYGQVLPETLRTSSAQPVSARISPFRPLDLCFLRARLTGGNIGSFRVAGQGEPPWQTKIRTRQIRLRTRSTPKVSFPFEISHLCTSNLESYHGSHHFCHKICSSPPSTPCVGLPPYVDDPWELQTALRRP